MLSDQVKWLFKSLDTASTGKIPRELVLQTFAVLREKNAITAALSGENGKEGDEHVVGLPSEKDLNSALEAGLPKGKLLFDYTSFVVVLFKATTIAASRIADSRR